LATGAVGGLDTHGPIALRQFCPFRTIVTARNTHIILRLPEVMSLTALGRSTIYPLLAAGQFPAPVQLSVRAVGWRLSNLDDWTAARPLVSH
jgi:prophage regulatory protein